MELLEVMLASVGVISATEPLREEGVWLAKGVSDRSIIHLLELGQFPTRE